MEELCTAHFLQNFIRWRLILRMAPVVYHENGHYDDFELQIYSFGNQL